MAFSITFLYNNMNSTRILDTVMVCKLFGIMLLEVNSGVITGEQREAPKNLNQLFCIQGFFDMGNTNMKEF